MFWSTENPIITNVEVWEIVIGFIACSSGTREAVRIF
jgi:hypothetical protein